MARDLVRGVGDVHDPGRAGVVAAAEDAVPQPEVEGRSDHDHEVAATERLASRLTSPAVEKGKAAIADNAAAAPAAAPGKQADAGLAGDAPAKSAPKKAG